MSCYAGTGASPWDGCICARYGTFRKPKFDYVCCEMLVCRVCCARQNFYLFSLYRNPDLDEQIYECLLTSIGAVLEEDVHASFLFIGDLHGYHKEWLGSSTTKDHGVAAIDFATASSYDQLVIGPTHVRGRTPELIMTDVADLVQMLRSTTR